MPGDTKVQRAPSGHGWIDIDNPSTTYRARHLARAARRGAPVTPASTLPSQATALPRATPPAKPYTVSTPPTDGLTSLQQRLFDRMTSQGVSADDARHVILSNGYNASASYGHMRAAGASHDEATGVIARGNPALALTYGLLREIGHNHAASLSGAMVHESDDDD